MDRERENALIVIVIDFMPVKGQQQKNRRNGCATAPPLSASDRPLQFLRRACGCKNGAATICKNLDSEMNHSYNISYISLLSSLSPRYPDYNPQPTSQEQKCQLPKRVDSICAVEPRAQSVLLTRTAYGRKGEIDPITLGERPFAVAGSLANLLTCGKA